MQPGAACVNPQKRGRNDDFCRGLPTPTASIHTQTAAKWRD
jgi:hypothetical protein